MSADEEIDLEQEVYTTFEVASICNANITSIKNWIEKGELQAHRTPGGHYRIKKKVIKDFLNRHDMPNPFAERERKHVLIWHGDSELEGRLRARFGQIHRYETRTDKLEALLKIGQWRPDVAIIEEPLTDLDALAMCDAMRAVLDMRTVTLVIAHDRGEDYSDELFDAGADFVVDVEGGREALYEVVRRAML